MTISEWLSARTPRPPDALEARIRAVLGDDLGADAAHVPERLLEAGERLVAALLRTNSTSRDSALDLLTADALVTYAFEAASIDAPQIGRHAASAMMRIASLGSVAAAVS